jgi:ABC-2 type transport system permease protein
MRNVPALLRRELNAYFASVMGYVVAMFFLVVMGLVFARTLYELFTYQYTQLTVMQGFFTWFWLPSLVVVPVITMRLLAEEKRSGTIEMLMTAPVSDFEVVFAKWLGAVVLYGWMWGMTVVYALVLRKFSGGAGGLDWGPIASGYLGAILIGQFCVAIGVLASSLTKNQIIAALMTFAVILILFLGSFLLEMFLQGSKFWKVSAYLSMFEHMWDFSRGLIDLRPVVLYVSGTVMMLFAAVRVVESRKWR